MPSINQKKTNSLAGSNNPYLLQHAHNPVNWQPWSPGAFVKAAAENKPVFLSIGYSTCHWCHVMEAESFSDPEVAAMMNDAFVCIKVDREERPDLDNIYMAFCQQMTGTGGWPLTIIMTPERKPFFAGTYFPKDGTEGRIGMIQLIWKVKDLWQNRKGKAVAAADEIYDSLQAELTPKPGGRPPHRLLMEKAFLDLAERYDEHYGGFGRTPKFPAPVSILFLIRYWKRTGSAKALEMALKTLRAIRRGGIYDHIGYGIHRYSTDEKWLVPHFEKMLCDQALTAIAFTEAYRATGKKDLREAATEILNYVLGTLRSTGGAFFSAEDADSEGGEGMFYTWTADEVEGILTREEFAVAKGLFNLSGSGNYSNGGNQENAGRNILFRIMSDEHAADEFGLALDNFKGMLEDIRVKMFAERLKRPKPFMDTKVMTDWNGLMITALAKAAAAFDEPLFADAAEETLAHINRELRGKAGELLHVRYNRDITVPAWLDDYAYLLWGMVELYQATFKIRYLTGALALAEEMLRLFWDNKNGGFFFAPGGSGPLPVRHKFANDSALPSGSAVAAMNLLRLGRLTARPAYDKKAAALGSVFSSKIEQYPSAFVHLVSVFDMALNTTAKVIIAGNPEREDTLHMISTLRKAYAPNTVAVFLPSNTQNPEITGLIPYLHDAQAIGGQATAIVCKDFICHAPTTDPEEMLSTIWDVEEGRL